MANLIDTIQAGEMFTTFTRAIKMTEIVAILREPGTYTVFAPTDAAFAQMKVEDLEDLFDDHYKMSKLVKYHMVVGIYRAAALLDMSLLKTMEGQRLTVYSSATAGPSSERLEDGSDAHGYIVRDTVTSTLLESIKVNGARITRANVIADNGIVHVIDKVLVPHFMVP
jgi:uncharacterized surface protein with fasciclin (FAS1) repeats